MLFCKLISLTSESEWERASVSERAASHSFGRWSAHLLFECETHVNVWVGVKRIEERVSMSQYENAQSVHLQEHLIRLAHQQTFFPSSRSLSLSPSLQPHALVIFDLQALIRFYANWICWKPRKKKCVSVQMSMFVPVLCFFHFTFCVCLGV